MCLPFTKASACGNDFLIIEEAKASGNLHQLTRRICDRHNGVGADGVEWISPGPDKSADAVIRLINADGSDAEISGNGTRCAAAYMAARGFSNTVRILTGAGIKVCQLISHTGQTFEFETEMGHPVVSAPCALKVSNTQVFGIPVSMGNPHFVVLVQDFSPSWQQDAAQIQQQKIFTQGVNVEFVRIAGPTAVEVRFFERGVGETQSSGTGSCASAVAAIAAGQVKSPVTVEAPGGTQIVRWSGDQVYLRGPAQIICRGEFFA